MKIDTTIEIFRLAQLDLDCRRIVLTQNKEGGARYEGKGYIRQTPDGVLVYKLYVTSYENVTPHGSLETYLSHIGKIHPDETFFNLEAQTRDGTTVRASRLFPKPSWDMSTGQPEFVSGELQALTAYPHLPQENHCMELYFFEEYDVPLNGWSEVEDSDGRHYVTDTAEFDSCDAHFTVRVRKGSGRSVLGATADKPFPPDFHWRVQESLQFITGKTATYRALVTCGPGSLQLDLISPRRVSPHPHFRPPIKHASMIYRQHGWELFNAYLVYVVGSSAKTQWNPLAYHLYNAREASANSVDAWAMGVSVALEAVSSLVLLPEDQESNAKTLEAVKRVKEYVAGEAALKEMKGRLFGLLDILKHPPGPTAKLKWLATQGRVEKAYINTWNDLRNAQVHPKLADLAEPDEATYQNQLGRIHSVQVLLCQVTYHVIGYRGYYTDYAAEDWPDKPYPLAMPEQAETE